jgi:hypothetical protein
MLWASIVVALLGLAPTVGRADLIIGNLAAATANDNVSQSINFSERYAVSFTMGSQAYSLSDAQIRLTFSPPNATRFQLESDAGGNPSNTGLVTFTNPTFGSGQNTYTFTADSPFTLAPNTTYWLVGSTTNAALSANWAVTLLLTNPSGSGASFGSYADTTTSGATWFNSASTTQFQLNGTPAAVPEPSSLVFASISACGAFGCWRRSRRKAELTA